LCDGQDALQSAVWCDESGYIILSLASGCIRTCRTYVSIQGDHTRAKTSPSASLSTQSRIQDFAGGLWRMASL